MVHQHRSAYNSTEDAGDHQEIVVGPSWQQTGHQHKKQHICIWKMDQDVHASIYPSQHKTGRSQ